MRVLLDTNIIIHREANRVVRPDIGTLFSWLDRLHHEKCVHPDSVQEIQKHQDKSLVETFKIKISSYTLLKTRAPETHEIEVIRTKYDQSPNDTVDTNLLKEVFNHRVDLLITEDKKLHQKARDLNISDRVFTIESFLEKVTAENPELADYQVLTVHQELFGRLDINDPFFDSFKEDYPGFEKWFNKKGDETAYVSYAESGGISAFLYVKTEGRSEDYSDIEPMLPPKRRLKVGTLKVIATGFKLGERFLKIIFDNALRFRVDEIYVTVFERTEDQKRLITLLRDWGFLQHGIKRSATGNELVLVRDFSARANLQEPQLTYPYISMHANKFIVSIYPQYHTELLPDSILRTESPEDYDENRPNRNALSKVFISRSIERGLTPGDIIVFYRTAFKGAAYYTSVATTLGVVKEVIANIPSLPRFIELCKKRSVFTDQELEEQWNYKPYNHPFIVNFLYVYSFSKRLNMKQLTELDIIKKAPQGFDRISDQAFLTLMEKSNADMRLVVD